MPQPPRCPRASLALGALLGLFVASAATGPAAAAALPEGFQETAVLTGLTAPTAVRFLPDGGVFVAEKSGLVHFYTDASDPAPTQVIDLSRSVHNYWDRGLLGLAVEPGFDPALGGVQNLYVLYAHDTWPPGDPRFGTPRWGPGSPTNPDVGDPCPSPPGATADGCVIYGRLSRIAVDTTTMTGVEQVLVESQWCQQYPSHSIGDLAFGRDGYLYVSAGDGASFNFADWGQDGSPVNPCGDPPDGVGGPNSGTDAEGGALRSQDVLTPFDPTTFGGSLLRIDVSGPTPVAPADNPLVGNGVADDDFIVAVGLRNPFRINDRPGTDEIWIADVGWNTWEELNRVAQPTGAVENFGWPCYEGGSGSNLVQSGYQGRDLCQALYAGSIPAGIALTPSFYAYRHADKVVPGEVCGTGSSSITGVEFEAGLTNYPPIYRDAVFFADSSRKCIWTIFADAAGNPDPSVRAPLVSQSSGRVVDLQMGPDGNLYYVDFDGGRVLRIEYFPANTPPTAAIAASATSGPSPLTVDFDASGSSDPEDALGALLFEWDLDGDGAFDDATGVTAQATFTSAGTHAVGLRVTDTLDATDTDQVTISVDDSPPVVVITAPPPGTTWAVDDVIDFAAQGDDGEGNPLPASQFGWEIILHHCDRLGHCHTHPVTSLEGIASGSFTAPDHEMVSFLELRVTARDLPPADWMDPAWRVRRRITFDNSGQVEDLVDFPVLVRLDPSRIDYAATLPGGADLRFADDFGTPLAFEIESWSPGGDSFVWVRVPVVPGGSATSGIWMYHDNPTAAPADDPAAVWSGYAGVWHQDPSLLDSSPNANDGFDLGSTDAPGWIGRARYFDGAAAIEVADAPSLRLVGNATLEAWVKIDDPNQAGAPRVMSKKPVWNDPTGFNMEYKPGENNVTSVGGGGDFVRADGVDLDTGWHYLASSIQGTSGAIYVDGVDRTTDTSIGALAAGTTLFSIGRAAGGGSYFLGHIDEVRIAPVARSADWIAAQHLSMSDAFASFGPVETPSVLSSSASVEMQPRTVSVTLETQPTGLQVVMGGEQATAPAVQEVIVGSTHSIDAPTPQVQGQSLYDFESWDDGGPIAHNVVVPDAPDTRWTATFALRPRCSDGLDNDGDGAVDWDGGGVGPADPECNGNPDKWNETAARRCGLGFEWAPLAVWWWTRRRRRRSA